MNSELLYKIYNTNVIIVIHVILIDYIKLNSSRVRSFCYYMYQDPYLFSVIKNVSVQRI
jgi:hypothetical protein